MTRRSQTGAPPVSPETTSGAEQRNAPTPVTSQIKVGRPQELDTPAHPSSAERSESWATLGQSRMASFLFSFVLHLIVLVILAIIGFNVRYGDPNQFRIDGDYAASEGADDLTTNPQLQIGTVDTDPDAIASEIVTNSLPSVTIDNGSTVTLERPVRPTVPALVNQLEAATSHALSGTFAEIYIDGRDLEKRQQVAMARGGTVESERAVERALEWLAAHQLPNGSWSLVHSKGSCNGRCSHDGVNEPLEPAATGLALLTFLGAGYTHKSGKYHETVNRGVYYLLQVMDETPTSGSFINHSVQGMYNHGIATFALSEAYQMSRDKDLKKPTQLAINFIIEAQAYNGGWRYKPKEAGDTTITGWQVMALKSAQAAGLNVPSSVVVRVDGFLDTVEASNGVYFGYLKPDRDLTCSSIGAMLRMFRGRSPTDSRILELAQALVKEGPSRDNIYFNYYATLFLYHVGGQPWAAWNAKMRDELVRSQSQSQHEAGSWYFEHSYSQTGGRLYNTTMAAMTLEIYYRFAPLYQQSDKPFEL